MSASGFTEGILYPLTRLTPDPFFNSASRKALERGQCPLCCERPVSDDDFVLVGRHRAAETGYQETTAWSQGCFVGICHDCAAPYRRSRAVQRTCRMIWIISGIVLLMALAVTLLVPDSLRLYVVVVTITAFFLAPAAFVLSAVIAEFESQRISALIVDDNDTFPEPGFHYRAKGPSLKNRRDAERAAFRAVQEKPAS